MKILLTHTPHMRDNYYGARALAGLTSLGEVVLHRRRSRHRIAGSDLRRAPLA
jgi:hypothetical protein